MARGQNPPWFMATTIIIILTLQLFLQHPFSVRDSKQTPENSPLKHARRLGIHQVEAEVQRLDALGRVLLAETVDEGEGVDLFATSEVSRLCRFM